MKLKMISLGFVDVFSSNMLFWLGKNPVGLLRLVFFAPSQKKRRSFWNSWNSWRLENPWKTKTSRRDPLKGQKSWGRYWLLVKCLLFAMVFAFPRAKCLFWIIFVYTPWNEQQKPVKIDDRETSFLLGWCHVGLKEGIVVSPHKMTGFRWLPVPVMVDVELKTWPPKSSGLYWWGDLQGSGMKKVRSWIEVLGGLCIHYHCLGTPKQTCLFNSCFKWMTPPHVYLGNGCFIASIRHPSIWTTKKSPPTFLWILVA